MVSTDEILKKLTPCLNEMEGVRRQYFQQKKKFWATATPIIIIGAILGVVLGVILPIVGFFIVAIIITIILGVIWSSMVSGSKSEYISTYKQKVIPEILKQFDESLIFDVTHGVSKSEFNESEIFMRPDRYSSEDLVDGSFGKTRVRFGEVHAEDRRTKKDRNGNRKTYYVTIFNGIYFMADFHKNFQGRTFVLSDFAENTFGNFGRALQKLGKKRGTNLVHMDDPEFEQQFAIYSTDEVECRYILSNSMMQNILKMKARLGGVATQIAFKNSCLYMAIPYREMMYLEPKLEVPATDEKQVRNLIAEVGMLLEIVEDLNLNTRIWSKE